MMRANIEMNRRATAALKTEIAALRRKKQQQQAMLIATRGALKVSAGVSLFDHLQLLCLCKYVTLLLY